MAGRIHELLSQLERDAIDDSKSVTSLLRQAKALATRLRVEEFSAWCSHEFDGYAEEGEEVPAYRIIRTRLQGTSMGVGHKVSNHGFHFVVGWSPNVGKTYLDIPAWRIVEKGERLKP